MDSNDEHREEVKSKSWTEIIADQFSVVAWIKGLKIYLAFIGILGLLVLIGVGDSICGVTGIILLVISYALNANESKASSESQEIAKKKSGSTGDSWRGFVGSFLLVIAWGYLLWKSTTGGYTKDVSAYTREPDAWCYAMTWCAIPEFILPALIFVTIPLTGLVYWLRGTFFRNMRTRMYARETIRFTYAFIYFLIFFALLTNFIGWHAPVLTAFDVTIMGVFFLASSFITVLPKFKPTKDDTKDVEFVTFFIVFTIINYTFFMLVARQITLSSQYKESSFEFAVIIFFVVLIVLFLSYYYILGLVRKYLITKIDDSYDLYKKEKNTGSLIYIAVMSFIICTFPPNGIPFIVILLGSLFILSHLKIRFTGLSDWETPLGNLTKYEFSLFAFNIVILLTAIYLIHDSIGEDNGSGSHYYACADAQNGELRTRSEYSSWENIVLVDCDLSNADLTGAYLASGDIESVSFNSANLRNADLSQSLLSGTVDFGDATLFGADLEYSGCSPDSIQDKCLISFANADLRNANLRNAFFPGVNLEGTNLEGAFLEGVVFTNTVINEATILSNNNVGAKFDYVDFSNYNFSSYDLTGISLKHANLTGAILPDNLSGVIFDGANLSGVNLSGAILEGITAFNLEQCPDSIPTNWICLENSLFGPDASFNGLDFTDGNLSNIDLSGSNFSSSILKRANLTNTNLSGAYFSYSNFDRINDEIEWYNMDPENFTDHLENIGFEGDFEDYLTRMKSESAADLSNAKLSGANLSYADLSYVNLSYADFSYSDLTDATLTQAELTGVTWYYTICPDGTNTGDSGYCSVS